MINRATPVPPWLFSIRSGAHIAARYRKRFGCCSRDRRTVQPFSLPLWLACLLACGFLTACDGFDAESAAGPDTHRKAAGFVQAGVVRAPELDEISGLLALDDDHWLVHNDDGQARLYIVRTDGSLLRSLQLQGAKQRDWEDITQLPDAGFPGQRLLVVGDFGDNHSSRKSVQLYFSPLPAATGTDATEDVLNIRHAVRLSYPDGPRDCESMAYDPASGQLLLLSKRDVPPRLYAVDAVAAQQQAELTLEFLGEVPSLRPPQPMDLVKNYQRGAWVSQPTGMDISPDGLMLALLTYRSVYLYRRAESESWSDALQGRPIEVIGPPGTYDEAVAFSTDGLSVMVTTENLPAPLWRLELAAIQSADSSASP